MIAIDFLRLTASRLWKLVFVLWPLDMQEAATGDKVQPLTQPRIGEKRIPATAIEEARFPWRLEIDGGRSVVCAGMLPVIPQLPFEIWTCG
jgi:hypothetical protein